ncbi:hypothetical protein [Petrachloros mirabilis]
MRHLIASLHVVALLAAIVVGQETIKVQGFSEVEAAAASQIGIAGPTQAKSGETVILRLQGTPTIDLTKPLVDQLQWLMGPDRLFAYLQIPKQPMVPLDVEGTIVFSVDGATMRPQVSFPAGEPGEYRFIVDWNFGQNQLVEHIVTVQGDGGDDGNDDGDDGGGDDSNPPVPPPSKLFCMILEETDMRANGLEGAKLNGEIESIASYLDSLRCPYQIQDDDSPGMRQWVELAKSQNRPALLVTAPGQDNRLIGQVYLDDGDKDTRNNAAEVIDDLKKMGVK